MANRMPDLTIEELAERGGVSVRTIRFYISEGLLPSSGGRGKAAAYGEEHLLRLRLIRRLGEQRVPLAEQRERLSRLSLEDVRALLAEEDQRSAELERARTTPSPREYVAGLLERARAARQAAPSNVQASGRVRGDQAPAWSAGETPASEGGGEADLSALGETGAPAAAPAASAPAIDA
ncbi:MAG TPA: MerR family transcriptional regulator, partial [Dehalococcoidia bacterium]|nr:MerR family transcriptional regulator [Dehalococcoidia bacterium]